MENHTITVTTLQINAKRHLLGRRGFAQEGLWGTPRRPRKMNCHVDECDEVAGSEQSLFGSITDIYLCLPVLIPVVLRFY